MLACMPLKRLKDDYRVTTWRGVEFWMADETGSLVFCRINREALRGQANRHFEGTYDKVFEIYQDKLEQVASDAFDADACNEAGWVIVTKEALDRMSRAPRTQNCITRPRVSRKMPPELAAKMQYDINRWQGGQSSCNKTMPTA